MEGYKELVEKLNGLVTSLENGELSLDELSTLEEVTRNLHERSIIMRYKAFETSVLGETTEEAPVEEENTFIPEPAPEATPEPESVEPEPEVQEEPTIDFSIFDEEEEAPEPELPVMDFSTPEPVSAAPAEEEVNTETVEPEVENTESALEGPAETEPVQTETPSVSPIVEEPTNVESVQTTTPDEEETMVNESVEIESPSIDPAPAPVASGSSFLDKFTQQDNSLAGRFSAGPLDSLIGAFGLNERLRFINDLFDGSSEKFSDAIKALDTQSGLDAAREKAAGYAEENEWDPEEEVVAEFMNYLNRRYA